ncbi:UNKNOWN [Stylonychia lemnae]|uniref:Uncharacterized protein n=1 Tax=Stylonychia lemnae TaxID=5949 RepID=A0A078AV84_STYLE|nr:UNKNOWN [Stylonychia lemnae]|eukprot:CDW85911.1 UNKNOWN [Stylonychia lemnae]
MDDNIKIPLEVSQDPRPCEFISELIEEDLDCDIDENINKYSAMQDQKVKKNPLLKSKGSHVDEYNLERLLSFSEPQSFFSFKVQNKQLYQTINYKQNLLADHSTFLSLLNQQKLNASQKFSLTLVDESKNSTPKEEDDGRSSFLVPEQRDIEVKSNQGSRDQSSYNSSRKRDRNSNKDSFNNTGKSIAIEEVDEEEDKNDNYDPHLLVLPPDNIIIQNDGDSDDISPLSKIPESCRQLEPEDQFLNPFQKNISGLERQTSSIKLYLRQDTPGFLHSKNGGFMSKKYTLGIDFASVQESHSGLRNRGSSFNIQGQEKTSIAEQKGQQETLKVFLKKEDFFAQKQLLYTILPENDRQDENEATYPKTSQNSGEIHAAPYGKSIEGFIGIFYIFCAEDMFVTDDYIIKDISKIMQSRSQEEVIVIETDSLRVDDAFLSSIIIQQYDGSLNYSQLAMLRSTIKSITEQPDIQ